MGGQHLERVVKKRRLAPKPNVVQADQPNSQQVQQKRGLQQLATTQNPGPPTPALLPNTNSILPTIHTTLPVGNLNLSPIVSAVSAPTWMDLSSSQPTPTSTPNPITSSASVATPTSSSTKRSQCATMTTTSSIISSSGSSVPVSGSENSAGPNDFFQSLGSSAGSIFVTTLVGLAILGVIFAISSWGLRRWCNRRRKKIIDDDTWKFLNTPQEFSKRALDEDLDSIKSMPHGFSGQIPHVLLHNDLPHNSVGPSHLFSTHLQAPQPSGMNQVNDSNPSSQFHSFVGFHQTQPPRMSCFMDDGQLSWISNPSSNSISPIYGGVILAPIGAASTDHLPTSSSISNGPEQTYGSPRVEMSEVQDNLMSSSSLGGRISSRIRSIVSIPKIETEESSTPLTKLPIPLPRIRQHPLSREISIARSDDSSTIEILRERVKDQKTNIRSELIKSIQFESESNLLTSDSIDSTTSSLSSNLSTSDSIDSTTSSLSSNLSTSDSIDSTTSSLSSNPSTSDLIDSTTSSLSSNLSTSDLIDSTSSSLSSNPSTSDLIDSSSSSLSSNAYIPIEKCQPTTPRPLRVQKKESLIRYQLTDEPLSRELSQSSCYSVTTTVIGNKQTN